MPSSLILAAIYGSEFEAAAALGSFGFAAASFALRLVTTYAIASLLYKNPQQQQLGTEIQLGPATDNKLNVVYGERYAKPIVTDAIISTDQKTMWYVLTISEAPTYGEFSIGEVYYDGKLLIFDPANPSEITGWYTQPKKHSKVGGTYNTKAAGKLSMWFYKNGSLVTGTAHQTYTMTSGDSNADIASTSTGYTTQDAISVLQDSAIPQETRWAYANTATVSTSTNAIEDVNIGDTVVVVDSVDNIQYRSEITNHTDIFGVGNYVISVDSDNNVLTLASPAVGSLTASFGLNLTLPATAGNLMTGATFAIIRLQYDQNAGIYGLGGMDIKLSNPQTQLPGYAIYDYLTNKTYGCGVDPANVNVASLQALDAISTQTLSIVDTDGNAVTNSFTYQVNGIVDTTQDCLTNLNNLTDACDSWIQWDERLGQWGVIMNISLEQAGGSTATMRVITSDHIIGGINLTPTDLKTSGNKITVGFPNKDIINQTDYRYYFLKNDRPELISPNEPDNNIDINMPFVTDSIQATYLGYRKLFMSREDVVINFSMDYSGIGINAGEIIAVNHEWYGWGPGQYNNGYYPGKPFRVTQVKESKDAATGFLGVQIVATAYNDSIYTTMNPHFYTPDTFGLTQDTAFLPPPGQPITPASSVNPTPQYPSDSVPYFVVSSALPQSSLITGIELWYGLNNNTPLDSTWNLAMSVSSSETVLPPSTTTTTNFVNFDVVNIQAGTYYFATRVKNDNITSGFSPISTNAYAWNPATSAGTAIDSTNAQNVLMNSGSGEYYITHSSASSGNSPQYANANLKFNSTNQTLTTPNINIGSVASLTPRSSAPSSPTTGMIAMATGTWGGLTTSTSYPTYYNGSVWKPMISA